MRRRRAVPGGDLVAREVVRRVPGRRLVLDGVSATFPAGSVVAVVAGNGVGKSTLARALAGIDRVDAGAVERPCRQAYFIPERVPSFAGCSTGTLAAALSPSIGRDRASVSRRLDTALDSLGFSHTADTSLRRLSKGNLQKAYLALAYALRPLVVVLDEPTTGLDASSGLAAGALVRSVAAEGGVVVVTAHQAVAYADLQHRLAAGRLAPIEAERRVTYVVELVTRPDPQPWWDGAGSYEVVARPSASAAILRLLVDEGSLAAVLRTALDHGDAVTRVGPADQP